MTVKELIEILSENKHIYDKQIVICNDSKTFHIKKVGIPQSIEIGNNFDFQTDL